MEENEKEVTQVEETQQEPQVNGPVTQDDEGTIKVDLSKLNKPQEDAVPEQSTDASDDTIGQSEDEGSSEEMVEEVRATDEVSEQPVQDEESVSSWSWSDRFEFCLSL